MKYFYKDIELDIPDDVYYPREDTEILAKTIEKGDLKNKEVLEIGCGSGLLSIIMAKAGAKVTSVDINPASVKTTKLNAKKNKINISVLISDLFENVKGKYDLIIFNPPYLPVGQDDPEDITYSGGSSGREIIERFIVYLKNYLKKNGRVLLVISSLTGEKETVELFHSVGMKAKSVAREKIPWEELIIIEALSEH
ncbi:MAG: methyltransferase [Candidatus Aenigmarchaeota archaeon]|nr:methyltransferase [Candidatus Aenigmarchaeota archaeon]